MLNRRILCDMVIKAKVNACFFAFILRNDPVDDTVVNDVFKITIAGHFHIDKHLIAKHLCA